MCPKSRPEITTYNASPDEPQRNVPGLAIVVGSALVHALRSRANRVYQ